MPLTTGSLPNYLENLVRRSQRGTELRNEKPLWKELCNLKSTKKETERMVDIQTIGPLSAWPEQSERPLKYFVEGWAQALSQFQYAGRCEITKPMVKFSQENLIEQCMSGLLDASRDSKNIQVSAMWEYGNTGATVPTIGGRPMFNQLCGDGVAYFGTHTWRDSTQTVINLSTSADAITEFTIATHCTNIRRWKNEHGIPLYVRGTRLMIPPELRQQAIKALQTRKQTGEPTTANHATNTAQDFIEDTEPFVNEFWSDTGDWYIQTSSKADMPLVFMGWEDETDSNIKGDRNACAYVYIDYSWAIGFFMPFGGYKVS